MMNNREDAEDILQEAFVQAFTKLESFRYESTFGAWLKRKFPNVAKRNVVLSSKDDEELFLSSDSGTDLDI